MKDHLDVTVLIKPPVEVPPQRVTEFALVKGTIRAAKGYLGAFEMTLDDYAAAGPVVARRVWRSVRRARMRRRAATY